MLGTNVIVLEGRSTNKPELKSVGKSQVATIRLAYNDRVKKNGKYEDKSLYIDCEVWGKSAEYVGERVGKGTTVQVLGKLAMDTWEKDGQERSKMKIFVRDVQVGAAASGGGADAKSADTGDDGGSSDDLPF